MSRKTSGLGRGLGDLLADNAPDLKGGATVVWRDVDGNVTVTPDAQDAVKSEAAEEKKAENNGSDCKTAEKVTIDGENAGGEAFKSADTAKESPMRGEGNTDISDRAPIVISAPSASPYENTAPVGAKNVEKSDPTGEKNGGDAPVVQPRRSLKALFKSYK